MFNNIIYFIVVLSIFTISFADKAPKYSFPASLSMLFVNWLIFAGYCRWTFQDLRVRLKHEGAVTAGISRQYEGLIVRLSILSIFLFAIDIYFLEIKSWIQMVPGCETLSVLQGILAVSLFLLYLCTVWYFAHPVYTVISRSGISKGSFLWSNLRFNVPILFPWILISMLYDLIALSPWAESGGFLAGVGGQLICFACILILLMAFLPKIIQHWWGCRPLPSSEKTRNLEAFLRDNNFAYRRILSWPMFEGHMLTAGLMGIVPRYRYILISDSLLHHLTIDELKAVLAHEMGHAKYYHFFFFILFFVGFAFLSSGLYDLFIYFSYAHPFFGDVIGGRADSPSLKLFYLFLSLSMLGMLLIYFRYIMGFFMRNFERQADLYSAVTMGTHKDLVGSLEKIAYLSGKSIDLPSWHHFSIRERVDCIRKASKDSSLVRRHNRTLAISFSAYMIIVAGLGYLLNFSPIKQNLAFSLMEKALKQEVFKNPKDIVPHQDLAIIYHQMERYEEAVIAYETVIDLDPKQAASLNNLAWLLLTSPRKELRDEKRALDLAKKAVALEKSSIFLDTLAEAYFRNGMIRNALETIDEAIFLASENRAYYKGQLKKFLEFKDDNSLIP